MVSSAVSRPPFQATFCPTDEYVLFYNAFFKDFRRPLSWHHFSGDSGSGVSFKAIIYLPGQMWASYYLRNLDSHCKYVGRTISRVNRWLINLRMSSWWWSVYSSLRIWVTTHCPSGQVGWRLSSTVRIILQISKSDDRWFSIPAEDLPLNVSRETLQSTRFLRQLKQIIVKRLLQLFSRLSEEDPEKWEEIREVYGSVFKLGAIEDKKNRDKLVALTRFATNQRNSTSLDQVGSISIFWHSRLKTTFVYST